jgi:transposase
MSDPFDITLERKLESNGERAAAGVSEVRRIELITGAVRRRRWWRADKARIVVESLEPGANVSEVARRNGLSPQQLFAWRREADATPQPHRKAVPQSQRPEISEAAPVFAPVVIAAPAPRPLPSAPSQRPAADSGTIEIAIGGAVVRIIGQVETSMLTAVLRAVRKAS